MLGSQARLEDLHNTESHALQSKVQATLASLQHCRCSRQDEFKAFLKAAGCKLAVVEFSAKWCGPCKKICPLVQAMSLQYQNVMFANVDVDYSQELAQTYHIKAIPTFQMFKQAHKK
ncbi:Thioredoxin Domain-Containing Protein 8 [Manis pentadactyla]|nr:Thioredoxin Domain-Containing Protein 8 [Manis pentadactyla]